MWVWWFRFGHSHVCKLFHALYSEHSFKHASDVWVWWLSCGHSHVCNLFYALYSEHSSTHASDVWVWWLRFGHSHVCRLFMVFIQNTSSHTPLMWLRFGHSQVGKLFHALDFSKALIYSTSWSDPVCTKCIRSDCGRFWALWCLEIAQSSPCAWNVPAHTPVTCRVQDRIFSRLCSLLVLFVKQLSVSHTYTRGNGLTMVIRTATNPYRSSRRLLLILLVNSLLGKWHGYDLTMVEINGPFHVFMMFCLSEQSSAQTMTWAWCELELFTSPRC